MKKPGAKRRQKTADDRAAAEPWVPMTDPVDVKLLGKLSEELGEAGAIACRCIIQGIDADEPVSGVNNRRALEDELADVLACARLAIEHYDLDLRRMGRRSSRKMARLRQWCEAGLK